MVRSKYMFDSIEILLFLVFIDSSLIKDKKVLCERLFHPLYFTITWADYK